MTPRDSQVVDEDESSMDEVPVSKQRAVAVGQLTDGGCQITTLPLNSPRVPTKAVRPLGIVFDLDGTLVAEPIDDHREQFLPDELFLRPGAQRFLAWCFERGHSLAVWTAAHAGWAHYVCWKLLQASEDGSSSSSSSSAPPRFEFVWDGSKLKKRRRIPRDAHGLETQDPTSASSGSETMCTTRCCWCGPYRNDCDRCECRLNRVFQCPCRFTKDLSKVWSKKGTIGGSFSRARTLLIENTPQQCLSNYGNAVYVPTYRGDQEDQVLFQLQSLILHLEGVDDVRTFVLGQVFGMLQLHPFQDWLAALYNVFSPSQAIMPSQPVVTERWAGNFDCCVCRRKRLTADEFSKRAIEKHRKTGEALKCKQCVQEAEAKERSAAAAKIPSGASSAENAGPTTACEETRQCAACHVALCRDRYNPNQWNKGPDRSRCRECVDRAVADESERAARAKEAAIEEAHKAVAAAQASGNAMAVLKAESFLAALEAEKVTGLKPQSMGGRGSSRGGRGRGGRGRGRGGSIR